MNLRQLALAVLVVTGISSAQAETIRVAIGTQDTTINCATGGLLIRELHLLENTCRTTANTKMCNTTLNGKTSPRVHR